MDKNLCLLEYKHVTFVNKIHYIWSINLQNSLTEDHCSRMWPDKTPPVCFINCAKQLFNTNIDYREQVKRGSTDHNRECDSSTTKKSTAQRGRPQDSINRPFMILNSFTGDGNCEFCQSGVPNLQQKGKGYWIHFFNFLKGPLRTKKEQLGTAENNWRTNMLIWWLR